MARAPRRTASPERRRRSLTAGPSTSGRATVAFVRITYGWTRRGFSSRHPPSAIAASASYSSKASGPDPRSVRVAEQLVVDRVADERHAATHTELGRQVGEMSADGVGADAEQAARLDRRPAARNQPEDFAFARTEDVAVAQPAQRVVEHGACHRRVAVALAARDRTNRGDQFAAGRTLDDVSGSSGQERLADGLAVVVHREGDCPRPRVANTKPAQERDSVGATKRQVHEGDVGFRALHERERVGHAGRLAGDPNSRLVLEDESEALSHEGVILDDDDAGHARWLMRMSSGTSRATRVPRPNADSMDRRAPRRTARSFIPIRPSPPCRPSPGSKPRPASDTTILSVSPALPTATWMLGAPLCLAALLIASWTIR